MPEGVTVTVAWAIKPEKSEEFVASLAAMFPETRLHKGFRSIRLIRSDTDANSFLLVEEWDALQNFNDYGQFRVDTGDTARLLEMTAGYPQVATWTSSPLARADA